jgi:putative cardiolipin synthase
MKKIKFFITLTLCLSIIFASANFSKIYDSLKTNKNFRFLASTGNSAKFIDGYRDAVQIRIDHFRTEKEEINAMHFIVREDAVGLAYLAELREAAKRGVKVKVIFDHYGSTGSSSTRRLTGAMVKHLMDAGVDIKFFNVYPKSTLKRLQKPKQWLKRMHEKLLLFRGHNAFLMGDRDLSGRYFGFAKQGEKFLSRDLYVVGPETNAAQDYFDKTFANERFTKYNPYE